jgi:hypothetical protein
MFRTVSRSIIRSLAQHTAIGICHTGSADCLLAGSEMLAVPMELLRFCDALVNSRQNTRWHISENSITLLHTFNKKYITEVLLFKTGYTDCLAEIQTKERPFFDVHGTAHR